MRNKKQDPFRDIILNLNERAQEEKTSRKKQNIAIAIGVPIVVLPIFLPGIMSIWNHALWGLGIMVLIYGIAVLLLLYRMHYICSRFYKIRDVQDKIRIIPVNDGDFLEELYLNSALTFIEAPDAAFLKFLYNWLNNVGVLKGETVNLYTFTSRELRQNFRNAGFDEYETLPVLCVDLRELNITEENKLRFSKEHFAVGARWLDDMVGPRRARSRKRQ